MPWQSYTGDQSQAQIIDVLPYTDFIFGLNFQFMGYPWLSDTVLGSVAQNFSSNGGQLYRKDCHWVTVEPNAPVSGHHTYIWNHSGSENYDKWVTLMAQKGLRWLPVLWDSPVWAARYPGSIAAGNHSCPSDAHIADFIAFCIAVLSRYGPGGSFWAENPTLPYLPVLFVEGGNEVNAGRGLWWGTNLTGDAWLTSSLSAHEYADVWGPTYLAIKAAFPTVTCFSAGFTGGPSSTGNAQFIEWIFAYKPNFKMDGYAIHPYFPTTAATYAEIRSFRDAIDTSAEIGKPIYITEMGESVYTGTAARAQSTDSHTSPYWNPGFDPNAVWAQGGAAQMAAYVAYILRIVQDFPRSTCNIVMLCIHTAVQQETTNYDREQYLGLYTRTGTIKNSGTSYLNNIRLMLGLTPTAPPGGQLIFNHDGSTTLVDAPPEDETPPGNFVSAWGNSLTEGFPYSSYTTLVNGERTQAWPHQMGLQWANGIVKNLGIQGQATDEIMLRQGGRKLTLTVTGGVIPASGPVAVTVTEFMNWRLDRNWSCVGKLNGTPGTLKRTATTSSSTSNSPSTFTFTRTTAGTAIALAGGHLFTSDQDTAFSQGIGVIWVGGNDFGYQPSGYDPPHVRIPRSVGYMIDHAGDFGDQQLIISCETTHTMPSGSAAYAEVMATNSALQAAWPDQYFDLRTYMVHQAIYDLGITPTADDLDAIAHDTLPQSIMCPGDPGHYAPPTAHLNGIQIYNFMNGLGWLA